MATEIVVAGPEDFPDALGPVLRAFLDNDRSDDRLSDIRLQYDDYRLLAAREDGRWVGDLGEFPFELTVPGGATVAAAGVTMVGVSPTHRRRGILTALMARALDDAAERGDPVAILLASESSIYGRFGYGVASEMATVHVDTAGSAFLGEPEGMDRIRLVDDPAEAIALAGAVWDRHRRWRPGTISRRPWTWELLRRDRPAGRHGGTALFWVAHEDAAGEPDGYAAYRAKEREVMGLPRSSLHVVDLAAVDGEVEAALVRFLCDTDLIHRVHLLRRPVVDPLRWRLRDPRQWVVDEWGDFLWARVLDVPAALSARTYAAPDRLVLEVEDRFRPAGGGRFAVEGGPGGGACAPTSEAPDLRMEAACLGSLLLGTVPPSVLSGAGRLLGEPDAVRRADAFFASSPGPFNSTTF